MKKFPNYLAAVDKKRGRIFVLSNPNLSAVKINEEWIYCEPISDEEIKNYYDLVTDFKLAKTFCDEARAYFNLSVQDTDSDERSKSQSLQT